MYIYRLTSQSIIYYDIYIAVNPGWAGLFWSVFRWEINSTRSLVEKLHCDSPDGKLHYAEKFSEGVNICYLNICYLNSFPKLWSLKTSLRSIATEIA